MLSDIFSFSFTLLLPNWLLISIRIYSGIARFPCDSMAFLLQDVFEERERDNDCCNMDDLQLSVEDAENRAEWRRTRVTDPLPEGSTA